MSNDFDPMMRLWCLAGQSTSIRNNTSFQVVDSIGQFDLVDSMLAGTITPTGEEFAIPFFCVRVNMKAITPKGFEQGIAIINTFKLRGEWVTTLVPGTKPSFELKQYTRPLPDVLNTLMNGQPINHPHLYMEMV